MATYDPLAVEKAIVDRLAPLRDTGLTLHALPEKPKEYGELLKAAQVGVLTVVMPKIARAGSAGCNLRMQLVTQTVMVYGRCKGLRDEGGMMPVEVEIGELLAGFIPPGVGPVRYGSGYKFLGRTDSDWEFEYGFEFQYMRRARSR